MKEKIEIKVERSELDDALKKVKRLRKILKEANSLADELASKNINVTVSI